MSLSLVAPRELPSAKVACERFLAGVRADVGRQVVTATKVPHAYPTLEGFVAGVDADVSGELVGPGEAPVAALRRAGVGTLVHGRLAGSVGVFPRAQDGPEGQILRAVGCG